MQRRELLRFVASGMLWLGIALAIVVVPAACDSSLNLGDVAEGGANAQEDGGAASCANVCDKVIGCGLVAFDKRTECISDCAKQAPQALRDCVGRTACADLQAACSSTIPFPDADVLGYDASADEIRECQSACDTMQFFSCITASELTTCRGLCASAPAAKRNTFRSCGNGAGSDCRQSNDCLAVLAGD